jgi:hypothetical protein
MVLRPPLILALLLALLLILGGLALLIPRGGERLVARASSKLSAAPLRDCLATKLGLTFSGDPRALHASAYGLRVVLTDNGQTRIVGLFTAGGRPLSSGESDALKACLSSQ